MYIDGANVIGEAVREARKTSGTFPRILAYDIAF